MDPQSHNLAVYRRHDARARVGVLRQAKLIRYIFH
jgi:hypothetical protein